MVLVGIDSARKGVDAAVEGYGGKGVKLILLTGPPGSGKTTLIEEVLEAHDYVVYRAAAGESTSRENAKAQQFCRTAHSVDVMLSGETQRRRAVLLDNCLADAKSIGTVYDSLKAIRADVLVVAAIGRSAKAPGVRRRADVTIAVPYPSKRAMVSHLKALFGKEAKQDALKRCADASGGSVQKAEQLVRGELYGTRAVEAARGVDTTIFEDVARGFGYCVGGRPFKDVEVAISCEPSMSAMIIRESLPCPSPETRRAYRMLSKTHPGSWYGTVASAVAFAETALRERAQLEKAVFRFPRCYTTTSSRTSNAKKRLAEAEAEAAAAAAAQAEEG